jgi:hypothetical protein
MDTVVVGAAPSLCDEEGAGSGEVVMQRDDDRSLSDLLAQLSQDMRTLLRQEVEIAQTEVAQKAYQAGKHVGVLALGSTLGYSGFLVLLAAMVMVLRKGGLPWWGAAVLVGVVVAGGGVVLAWKGMQGLRHDDLVPRQTIEILKRTPLLARVCAGLGMIFALGEGLVCCGAAQAQTSSHDFRPDVAAVAPSAFQSSHAAQSAAVGAPAQRTDVRIAAALFSLAPGVIKSKKFFLSKKELMKKEET